jgi:hypothetical protein
MRFLDRVRAGESPDAIRREQKSAGLSEAKMSRTKAKAGTTDVIKFLNRPLAEMGEVVNEMDPSEIDELAGSMAGLAEKATRIASYLSSRAVAASGYGPGSTEMLGADHNRAVKDQNRAAMRLRKALGFTQAQADINF